MLTQLSRLVAEATESLEAYDYARVLERTESFFWGFCDDYLEMVKARRYGDFGPEARGERQQRDARGAVGAAAALRAVPAVRHRGSVVVVAARVGASRHVADAGRSGRADRRRRRPRRWRCSSKAQAALADVRRIKAMEKRAVKSVIERAVLPRRSRASRRPRATSRRRRTSATLTLWRRRGAAAGRSPRRPPVKAGEPAA